MGEGLDLGGVPFAAPPRGTLEKGGLSDVLDVLHLGCGRKYMKAAVNVDISPDVGADVVHDLAQMPWPLPSSAFREVHAFDVIEHLDDILRSMEEIHRVCKPGARVFITGPHFSSANAFTDPTHRHQFSYFTFDYFGDAHGLAFYSKARFTRRRVQIVFYPSLANKIVHRLANRRPAAYEQRWAWMFPAWFLSVELEALK
jgi:SAM-dependent methyltransferase